MAIKLGFAVTPGKKTGFALVSGGFPFFTTSGKVVSFPITTSNINFFTTSGKQISYPVTINQSSFFSTSGVTTAFPVVTFVDDSKLLKLKFNDFDLASDYSTITANDGTGEYDPTTNPGGYNPEADPTDPNRAKRTEVDLYLGVRIWKNSSDIPIVFYPGAGDPQLNPWEYTVAINDDFGVYQFYLVGVPIGTPLSQIDAHGNSIFDIANCLQGWYITTAGVIVDPEVYNCINKYRYNFLKSVMCGACEGIYLEMYSWFVGALNAFSIGTDDAYIQGMALIEKIKEACNKEECQSNCGGNSC